MNDSPADSPAILTAAGAIPLVESIRAEVARVLVGQDEVVHQVLCAFLAGGHVLLEGVPGLGKTLLVKALAKTFSGSFGRVQFTPDLMPADVMGHALFDPRTQTFVIRRGPVFTHLLLADEINRAPAKTQSALLEVMQEQQVTIEGESHPVPSPFMVLATQNPLEQEGTYPLPEAQLDRFLLKVRLDYPSEAEEIAMTSTVTRAAAAGDKLDVATVNAVVTPEQVRSLRAAAAGVSLDDKVLEYAVRLVRATRSNPGLAVGAGPRGSLSLVRVARARALLESRDFVLPEDVKAAAIPVLRHRVTPTPEMEIEGRSRDRILLDLIEKVPAPRQ